MVERGDLFFCPWGACPLLRISLCSAVVSIRQTHDLWQVSSLGFAVQCLPSFIFDY
jgi:hypothetical protein